MLTITDALGKKSNINDEFRATGDPALSDILNGIIAEIDPEGCHTDAMAFIYYELEKRGFDVAADPEDLTESQLPPGAIA